MMFMLPNLEPEDYGVPTIDVDFTVELRQVFDMEEFPPDVQKAAGA